ncbi:uncharacterized protein HaLaN_09613 [Haematococcus lacustris]|uniref:Uncharacterized protein n=1 Tax=Haematococcus lacustris TaxID=44745 RepID=A0A699Z3R0_HAELA|nr:uncharacterized protein HaLaN_09613 [Haematococcus lacustris]
MNDFVLVAALSQQRVEGNVPLRVHANRQGLIAAWRVRATHIERVLCHRNLRERPSTAEVFRAPWHEIPSTTPFASSDSFDETTENLSHVKSSRLLLETSAPLLMTPILALCVEQFCWSGVTNQSPSPVTCYNHRRPTQMAVGMQQVGVKEAKVSAKVLHQPNKKKADKWLRSRPVPVVLGPGGPSSQQPQRYLIDHHHLTFALFRQGITHCYCQVVSDQSALGWEQFWEYMEGDEQTSQVAAASQPVSVESFTSDLVQHNTATHHNACA